MAQMFFPIDTDIGAEREPPAGMIDEECLVVGIGAAPDGSPKVLLAREAAYGLEYAGDAVVLLDATEQSSFWTAVERLACDYPHLRLADCQARWVRPDLRVRISLAKGARQARLCGPSPSSSRA